MSWQLIRGNDAVVIAAIHAGHHVRPELRTYLHLDEQTRLREEDPYTDEWTDVVSSRIVVDSSRFEVDLNRHLDNSVYLHPHDAWGLKVWKTPLPANLLRASRQKWRAFYAELADFLDQTHATFGRFVVLDIHSYCHRRGGAHAPPDDPETNPEVNVGTGGIEHSRWAPLVQRFLEDMRSFDLGGEELDVRENVKFTGGHFSRWINQRYGSDACALAVEFKKTFMDEWTGELDQAKLQTLKHALASTLAGIHQELAR